jgi:WD40 repeat protein
MRVIRFAFGFCERQTLEGHSSWVLAVAFSPEGQILESASYKAIQLWDVTTGAWKETLVFSLDGKVLASAPNDKTVRLWDASTGAWKQTLEPNIAIASPLFSEGGRYLKTDRGLLSLNSDSPDTFLPQEQSIYAISVNSEWVIQNGQNLLWLPPDYRAECSAFFNNMLALGCPSGRVFFIEFVSS